MKLRTWQTGLGVLCALFMVLLIQARVESAEKSVKMKLAATWPSPETSMMSEVVKSWEDDVTKRTNGAITFENFWGCALGSPPEHIELVKNGAVQAATLHQWYTPTKMPFGDFEYVFPFGPTDYELVAKAGRQIRAEFPQFKKEFDQQNVVCVAKLTFGVYNFMSKEPLRTVKDFEGKKVSLIGRYFGKWLPPGATAVVRPGQERYDLLRTGVVDADLLPFDLLYSFKIQEVTKYYDQVDLITCNGSVIVMNKDAFNSLSPENQKIVLEAGQEAEMRAVREIIPKWVDKCSKEWKAAGMEFIVFPKEEKVKWANSVPDTAEEWALEMDSKGLPGTAVVKRWQEITAKMGYEWPRRWGPK
jgi:TRAP-type C4-dicarboxylate transport system substrate-binding protein